MAAIVCRHVTDCINGTCNVLGQALCLPCRVCGIATETMSDIVCSPFFLYLATACSLNIPPIVFTMLAAGQGCQETWRWMLTNAVLCTAHIAAAFYITIKIVSEEDTNQNLLPEINNPQKNEDATRSKSIMRMRKILCDDPGVAVYIVVLVFYLAWTMVGISRTLKDGHCNDDIQRLATNALFCDIAFISFGGVAFCCSLCCLW